MVPVDRALLREPHDFDQRCRQPGNDWLAANQDCKRPRDFCSPFRLLLAAGFRDLCAYSAMWLSDGTVDHFDADHALAYEWSNYRYAAGWINSSKK